MAEFTETVTRTVGCPYCAHDKVVKNGRNANGKQTYRCKECGKRFLHTGQVGGHRAIAEQIGTAIRMYYGGTSYKQTAETLDDAYDISEPSKAFALPVGDRVQSGSQRHPRGLPRAHVGQAGCRRNSGQRRGGEKYWLWNVMDANARYALAVHLSPNRDNRAAVAVMRKVMAAAYAPPRSITTDKLGSYTSAIKNGVPGRGKAVITSPLRWLIGPRRPLPPSREDHIRDPEQQLAKNLRWFRCCPPLGFVWSNPR